MFGVVPEHRAAASPEPMNTGGWDADLAEQANIATRPTRRVGFTITLAYRTISNRRSS
jgi:hypothetical protein